MRGVDVVKEGGGMIREGKEASRGLLLRGTRVGSFKSQFLFSLSELEEHFTPSQPASQPASSTTGGRAGSVEKHGKKKRLDHRVSAVLEVLGPVEEEPSGREGREGSPGIDAGGVRKDDFFFFDVLLMG